MRTQADLVALTARLIDVPSVSGTEGAIADLVTAELRPEFASPVDPGRSVRPGDGWTGVHGPGV